MSQQLPPLRSFAKNVHSQYGEDGIVGELLRRVSSAVALDRWCVEFGAWDGVYLSNTCNLVRNAGYRAVLIEGSAEKFKDLCANFPGDDIVKLCRFVEFEGDSTLDALLKATPIPKDFDFLSIDIDGCDYYIFESLKNYRPKIVCVEFNPTIPNDANYVQPRDFSLKQGAGPRSLIALADTKDYALAAVTECNLMFVRKELLIAATGNVIAQPLAALRDDGKVRTFIFSGFDGTVLIDKPALQLPWHGLSIGPERLQQLPRFLRCFPSDYGPFQNFWFGLLVAVKFPRLFRERLAKQLRKKKR
jgi:Methyltransferase FkbM domain